MSKYPTKEMNMEMNILEVEALVGIARLREKHVMQDMQRYNTSETEEQASLMVSIIQAHVVVTDDIKVMLLGIVDVTDISLYRLETLAEICRANIQNISGLDANSSSTAPAIINLGAQATQVAELEEQLVGILLEIMINKCNTIVSIDDDIVSKYWTATDGEKSEVILVEEEEVC